MRTIRNDENAILAAQLLLCVGRSCPIVPIIIQMPPTDPRSRFGDDKIVAAGFDSGDIIVLGAVTATEWRAAELRL